MRDSEVQKALGTLDSRDSLSFERATLLGRVAPCGACVVRVRRERLALSVRQDSIGYPAETDRLAGAYLNTAGKTAVLFYLSNAYTALCQRSISESQTT